MLRDRYDPIDLFACIPTLSMQMDPILAQIDILLADDTIFQVVKADLLRRFPHTADDGRPSTPVEVILRIKDATGVAQDAFADCTVQAREKMKRIMEVARQKGEEAAERLKTTYRDMERWVGLGVIAHDLHMIAQHQAERAARQAQQATRRSPKRPNIHWRQVSRNTLHIMTVLRHCADFRTKN
jgi:hypothetical protein